MPSGSLAAACFAVRALTDPTIPTNGGCFRPIKLHLPEGLDRQSAGAGAVNARTSTIKRITGCMIGAFAQIRARARAGRRRRASCWCIAFGGSRPDGARYVIGELIAGGSGASAGQDGVDVIETDATNCMNLPAEALELDAPIRVHRVALRAGFRRRRHVPRRPRHRARIRDPARRGVASRIAASATSSAPPGLDGGSDGRHGPHSVIHRAGGGEEVIPSKIVTTLRNGRPLVFETAGGGGYGDPHGRPAEQVREDVRNGKVSEEAARSVYGRTGQP